MALGAKVTITLPPHLGSANVAHTQGQSSDSGRCAYKAVPIAQVVYQTGQPGADTSLGSEIPEQDTGHPSLQRYRERRARALMKTAPRPKAGAPLIEDPLGTQAVSPAAESVCAPASCPACGDASSISPSASSANGSASCSSSRPPSCARTRRRRSRRYRAGRAAVARKGLPASGSRNVRPGWPRRPGARTRGGWPGSARPGPRFPRPAGCRWRTPADRPAPRSARAVQDALLQLAQLGQRLGVLAPFQVGIAAQRADAAARRIDQHALPCRPGA